MPSTAGYVKPNIGFSQVGYLPSQPKVSVIELDKKDTPPATASIYKIDEHGRAAEVFSGPIQSWGDYYKYHYVKFDFSFVNTPGIYYIQYGDQKTNNFIIDETVYDKITDATSDIWIPIHMNHMFVREGYRVWHGEPFKEGYRQAPPDTDHFDLHGQGPTTDTEYEGLELIPGLNTGGFFDAGDFDIETGSNIGVVQNFVQTWEYFKPQRDQTFVSQEQRYVDLHRPDGTPDILQFIEHGAMNLVAQAEIIGHMAQTLSNSVLYNYHHLGDAASITDGLPYNPEPRPLRSGCRRPFQRGEGRYVGIYKPQSRPRPQGGHHVCRCQPCAEGIQRRSFGARVKSVKTIAERSHRTAGQPAGRTAAAGASEQQMWGPISSCTSQPASNNMPTSSWNFYGPHLNGMSVLLF
jgi:hypothetical protein